MSLDFSRCVSCFLIFFTSLTLLSCINDRNESIEDSLIELSVKDYKKLSPWNENEILVKNVQKSFIKGINVENFVSQYGNVYWDYAITFNDIQKAGLAIPVVKNNKINLLLKATITDDIIHLQLVTNPILLNFSAT